MNKNRKRRTKYFWGVKPPPLNYKHKLKSVLITQKDVGTNDTPPVSYTHLDVYKRQPTRYNF